MQQYTGTKTVRAIPMTRLAYNQLREWTLPENENGDDEGYLVEYLDGGQPNHPDYTGYISWSPKDVFERAYQVSETHVDRMKIESKELTERTHKLADFLDTLHFTKLNQQEQQLMRNQLAWMQSYLHALNARISLASE